MNTFPQSDEHNQRMAEFAIAHIAADARCTVSPSVLANALGLARCLPSAVSGGPADALLAWWDRARVALASVTFNESMLSGVGLRGGTIVAMEFVQGNVHIDLEVEPLVRHTTRRGVVRGQVQSVDNCEGIPVVLVDEAGNEAASTTLDDLGFFSVFLPVGTYAVAFALPTGSILAKGVLVQ